MGIHGSSVSLIPGVNVVAVPHLDAGAVGHLVDLFLAVLRRDLDFPAPFNLPDRHGTVDLGYNGLALGRLASRAPPPGASPG